MTLAYDEVDVLIIGAGPAGSLAAALLNKSGINVLVVEKQAFPRFSIGESLLPQLMVFLEKAGMLDAISSGADAGAYQYKNGAAFRQGDKYSEFNFHDKSSPGPHSTFQVKRADFDKRLADEAIKQGVEIKFEQEVISISIEDNYSKVIIKSPTGTLVEIKAGFILDASGFGRVLPRLFDLEYPSDFPSRQSLFCHIEDNITEASYDRNKILISVHPENKGVWYWLIPFSDGTSSLGMVGSKEFMESLEGSNEDRLKAGIAEDMGLDSLLKNSKFVTEIREISGYSANVKSLYGDRFALLGNAGEFLDPVFSSGVTIAFKSADLASSLLIRRAKGEEICWEKDYSEPLKKGVDTFRAFVNAWYDGSLQDIFFFPDASADIKRLICSVLAGYAWDESNPYVTKPKRRLAVLADICKE